MTILFLDTERDQHNRIIQIGVAAFDNEGELMDTFKRCINTGVKIPKQIEALTGIKNDFLEKQPSTKEVNEHLEVFLGKLTQEKGKLLAYAWGDDSTYIKKYYDELEVKDAPLSVENIQKRVALELTEGKKKTISLKSACDMLNIQFEQTHDALQDAIKTAHVYFELQKENVQRYINLEILSKTEKITIAKPAKDLPGYLINCEGIAKKNKNKKRKIQEEKTKEEIIEELYLLERKMNYAKERTEKYKLINKVDEKCTALMELFKKESNIYQKNKQKIQKMKETITEIYKKKEKEMLVDTKENRKELRLLIWLKKNIETIESFRITGYTEQHWELFEKEYQKIEVKEKNHA